MRTVGALGVVLLFAFALPACGDDPLEPCGVDERVESGSCVPCSPGRSNTAGDDPSGADTSCDAVLCELGEHVVNHACTGCAPGTMNAAGDDASGADTSCDATLCPANRRVVTNACVACPPGTTNAAGDDASGANTSCDATLCPANQRVMTNACVACPPGSTNVAGDDASGANTSCDATLCTANQRVLTNACVACAPGSTNAAGDDASGANTSCDATLCPVDQHVVTNACVACAPGTTNAAGDDASGADTSCEAMLCPVNRRVLMNTCVACPAGESNPAGDDATGGDTACERFAVLRLAEVAPNQTGSQDLVELAVLAGGTLRDITIDQDGVALATLPDITVTVGQVIVVHLNPAAGVTTELTTQAACTDAACYPGAWDINGGTTGITYSRRVLAVVDPTGDNQDVAAFSNLSTAPAGYVTELQAVQGSGDWLPSTCGSACTDATTPSANDVSADWTGVGTGPAGASVQRRSTVDTNAKADWGVAPGTFGALNPGPCGVNEHVVMNTCVACPVGQSNAAGDDPAGANTTCDVVALLRLTEVAPNQTGSQDLVELAVLAGGTVRDITIEQDGVSLATLPDITVSAGQLIVVHLNPAAGVTTEVTTQADCTSAACYPGVWDINGGTTGIAYTRRVLAVVDPSGDNQDVAAFTNLSMAPAGYVTELQAVQGSGDWLPSTCGGSACTDATTPSANDVTADWTGVGTAPAAASVQRRSTVDTDAKADWGVAPGTFGVLNPGPCGANEHVVMNTCVACPVGQSNLAGDDPAGANTACDVVAVLQLSEIAPNQTTSRDLIEILVLAGGTVRDVTFEQDGVALATLPDITVSAGQRIVVHLNPAAGVTTEVTTQAACTDAACYPGAWDFNGGTTGIAYSRRVLAVVDPSGDIQDVAAFSNLTVTPATYVTALQAVQASGDWLPSTCGGSPCTDATTPSANAVSANWMGLGTTPTSASVRRASSIDTDTNADWTVAPGTFGAPP